MTLRAAAVEDLRFICELETTFCERGLVGSDDLDTHQRRLHDPNCAYSIVEASGSPAGFVILCGLLPPNQSVELKRIVIAEPGRGLGRQVLKKIIDRAFTELSAHRPGSMSTKTICAPATSTNRSVFSRRELCASV